jgi:hypothetical protein
MTHYILIDEEQLPKVLTAIDRLKDDTSVWQHLLVSAAPVFFGAILGLAFGFGTDWLKTRREHQKLSRERQEVELAKLSSVMTILGFNVESLLHTVMQQVLPHYKQSHAAIAAVSAVKNNTMDMQQFDGLLHSEFRPMMARCPELYLMDVELFKEVPFVLANDPELLKHSGWILAFTRHLKFVLSERNKIIDLATIGKNAFDIDINMIERQAETQAAISDAEIVNCFQLFEQILAVCKRLENVIRQSYKDVVGPKLRVQPPEVLQGVLEELERHAKAIVPDWPPPEPAAV